jgi:patatin-related protein
MADTAGPTTRELRIAPVMTGGTSLAVWIGGVTAELYRVVNREPTQEEPEDVYGKLLKLTDTDAIVDVITGTSAGGLNGVLLAAGWALRVPTEAIVDLRDVWLQLGSIEALLRKPSERNPPSLLRGDDYFWPELTKVLGRLGSKATAKDDAKRVVDLLVTVTTLAGEPTTRLDDLDQQLNETRQAHTIRFDRGDIGGDGKWAERMALAARTSASIPGVFEASYLPIDEEAGGRPAFAAAKTSFKRGRWAVDGGVLVNEPLGPALERIWRRDADGEVRRVALFVNPTPAEAAESIEDDAKTPPKLIKVAASALTAPRNIGIATDIDRLREHNGRTRKGADVRRAIGELTREPGGLGLGVNELATTLYQRFCLLRTAESVQSMLERNAPSALVQDSTKRRTVEEVLIDAARHSDWLPASLPEWNVGRDWPWGLASIEYGAAVLLELIVRAFRLPVEAVDAADPDLRVALGSYRKRIHERVKALEGIRNEDNEFWTGCLETEPDDLRSWAERCYAAWPDIGAMGSLAGPSPLQRKTTGALGLEAAKLAEIGVEVCAALEPLVPVRLERYGPTAEREIEAIGVLRSIIWPNGRVAGDRADPRAMLRRLVALHVVAVVFGDTTRRPALVDLIEVSWRAPNALDPDRAPGDKLAGTEFGRLGAFIKPSWRANDWMWGRMDGAYQLVLLLLDPARIRQLGHGSKKVIGELGLPTDGSIGKAIDDELAYLDPVLEGDPPKDIRWLPVPRSLPVTATFLARELQTQIARQELPHVYDAVMRSREEGAQEGDGGGFRRAYERAARDRSSVMSDTDVAELVRKCRIGDEDAGDELGQDLLTRTGGRVAAVAANAATGEQAGVPWPAKIAAPLRQAGLAVYAVTYSTTTSSKTSIALSATLFALAGAIVAMRILDTDINVGLVFLASLILLLGALIAIMRSGIWSQLPVMLALLVVALALIGPDIAQLITSDPGAEEWKQDLFLATWSVATIVILIGAASWLSSLVTRSWRAFRRFNRERRLAELAQPLEWSNGAPAPAARRPSWPWSTIVEIVATLVLLPAILLLQKPFFEFVLIGSDTGWRAWVIDAGTWLGDRHIAVVILGLVFVGIFFGLAWDRGFRRLFVVPVRQLRRWFRWSARQRSVRRLAEPVEIGRP